MTSHRILVLTASAGAGHDRPARELAARFTTLGHTARVVDLVDITPFGHTLRGLFRTVLTRRPALWGRMCMAFETTDRLPALLRQLVAIAGFRIARLIDDTEIDLIVSTYPLGGAVIEHARLHSSRLVPLATYITDPAVHALWIDRATNLYLTTWLFAVPFLERLTTTPVAAVAPAITRGQRADESGPVAVVQSFGRAPLALVASGSWGVGDVVGTVRDLVVDGRFRPIVACGRNEDLRAEIDAFGGAVALGWVNDMTGLMRQCAIGVLNSGGLTLAEAATVGLPVIHHEPLPGQGVLNAAACHAGAGVPVSRTATGLSSALDHARPMTDALGSADPVVAILSILETSRTLPAVA